MWNARSHATMVLIETLGRVRQLLYRTLTLQNAARQF